MGPLGREGISGVAKQPNEKLPLCLHAQGALSIKRSYAFKEIEEKTRGHLTENIRKKNVAENLKK